ncbi:hypothetical protein COCOBI_03-1730 [Coccomyxa sp. Obi]|nr:hypothetical protein COCOBI_03-1730 [Coccomyxa sp. Obi]
MNDAKGNQVPNKLVEQATSKADLSYSYWAAGQSKSGSFTEKKLTEAELKEQEQRAREASQKGVSVWNQAGTFEERDVSGWAKDQLQLLLVGLEHRTPTATITLTEVKKTTGEAHVWLVRGKKRAGFDLTFEAAWRATTTDSCAAEATGTLSLTNVSPDELDELGDLLQVTVSRRDEGISSDASLMGPVKSIADKLREQLNKLHQLLKDR